jgi:hypothetical protein
VLYPSVGYLYCTLLHEIYVVPVCMTSVVYHQFDICTAPVCRMSLLYLSICLYSIVCIQPVSELTVYLQISYQPALSFHPASLVCYPIFSLIKRLCLGIISFLLCPFSLHLFYSDVNILHISATVLTYSFIYLSFNKNVLFIHQLQRLDMLSLWGLNTP